jgi:hypothetical protein
MRRCKAHGSRFCWTCFGIMVGFPIEHLVWEKTPLRVVMQALGVS